MTNTTQTESDELTGATRRIDIQSMRDLIYPRPAKRIRLPLRLIFVAAFLSTLGCATSRPAAVETETVGNLSASYHSVAVAPLKHDAPPELGQVVGSDDDDTSSVATTVSTGEVVEAPAVAVKTDGVTVGGVR